MRRHPSSVSLAFALAAAMLVAGQAAAQTPRAPAPQEDMEVCRIGSFTGFRMLGADTCMKVGGFVRFSTDTVQTKGSGFQRGGWGYAGEIDAAGNPASGAARRLDRTIMSASGTMRFDARNSTDHGLMRTYMEMRVARDGAGVGFELEKAFIRWGDFIVGRFQSFYDFSANDYNTVGSLGSDVTLFSAAYTVSPFADWYLTGAIEDSIPRRMAISPNYLAPYSTVTTGRLAGVAYSVGNAGQRWPDGVVSLLYDPTPTFNWQLSGALHPVVTDKASRGSSAPNQTKLGFGVQVGLRWEPSMLPRGDALVLQAAYTKGALSYAGVNAQNSGYGNVLPLLGATDGILTGPQAQLRLVTAMNVLGTAIHYWRPDLDSGIWAAATTIDHPNAPLYGTVTTDFPDGIAARNYRFLQIGAGMRWRPVRSVQVSLMGNWYLVEAKRLPTDWVSSGAGTFAATPRFAQGFQSSLRIQSSF